MSPLWPGSAQPRDWRWQGFAGSALPLGGAIALAGVSTGLASPPLAAAVSRHVTDADRPLANGAINVGTAAGIILSGLAALAFAAAWRELYFGFAGIAAATTLWLWRAIPGETDAGRVPTGLRLRRCGLVPLCLAALAMGGASTAIWTFGADILRVELGFSDAGIALAWIVLGAAGLAGLGTGVATDRLGMAQVHRLSLSLSLMAIAMICLAAGGAAAALPYLADRADLGLGLPFLMIAAGHTAGAPAFGTLLDGAGAPVALAAAALLMTVAALPAPRCRGITAGTADPACVS
ncbi:MFS transporter [Cereibacter sphaeroides]|uniref:MFS transporter n=1 Tax=Cereibacter sphaeroides TaxID=1063 RepID=UPI003990A82F